MRLKPCEFEVCILNVRIICNAVSKNCFQCKRSIPVIHSVADIPVRSFYTRSIIIFFVIQISNCIGHTDLFCQRLSLFCFHVFVPGKPCIIKSAAISFYCVIVPGIRIECTIFNILGTKKRIFIGRSITQTSITECAYHFKFCIGRYIGKVFFIIVSKASVIPESNPIQRTVCIFSIGRNHFHILFHGIYAILFNGCFNFILHQIYNRIFQVITGKRCSIIQLQSQLIYIILIITSQKL